MDIVREQGTYSGQGGDPVRVERFAPAAASDSPRPGVVVVHEVFGLDAFARSVGERLARTGFVALVPDLYARGGLPGPASTEHDPAPEWSAEQIRSAVAGLPDRRAVADLDAAALELATEDAVDAERIAAMGFCMGGCLAFLLGCQSTRVAAVVDLYGRIRYAELDANKPVQPLDMALNLHCPLLAVFGEQDATIPPDDVRAMQERLAAFAKPAEVVSVPGVGHGFVNPLRPGYDESVAEETWGRALAFLEESLA